MEAVAHNADFAAQAGVPQSVGKDFAQADLSAGITKTHNGKPLPGPHKRLPEQVRAHARAKVAARRRGL
jgi:hypothetical protein